MIEEKDVAEIMDDPIPEVTPEVPATEEPNQGEQKGDTPAPIIEKLPEVPKAENETEEKYVPISRFNEVYKDMKDLRDQNTRLQYMVEERLKPPTPEPEPEDELLDPAIKKMKQDNQQLRQALGAMADKQDLMDFKTSVKDYSKYSTQVDQIRADMGRRGQYVSRLDAYTFLQGREQLNKPVAKKVEPMVDTAEPKPEPIPATKPAAQNKVIKKPLTLEENREALKDVQF